MPSSEPRFLFIGQKVLEKQTLQCLFKWNGLLFLGYNGLEVTQKRWSEGTGSSGARVLQCILCSCSSTVSAALLCLFPFSKDTASHPALPTEQRGPGCGETLSASPSACGFQSPPLEATSASSEYTVFTTFTWMLLPPGQPKVLSIQYRTQQMIVILIIVIVLQ